MTQPRHMLPRNCTSFVAAAAVFLLAACSRAPSVALGKQTLREMVTSQSDGRLAVTDFTRTNGIKRELAGQPLYTMEYAATIRFEKGGWKGGDALVGYFSSFEAVDRAPGGWGAFGRNWKFFKRKAEIQLTGEIDFEKTDNGWRSKALNVKTARVISNRPDEEYYDQFVGLWVNDRAVPLKIIKKAGRYKLLNNYNETSTILDPEN